MLWIQLLKELISDRDQVAALAAMIEEYSIA